MKNLLVILLILQILGCAKVKDDPEIALTRSSLNFSEDIDFDGIPDEIDSEQDIANIPSVEIKEIKYIRFGVSNSSFYQDDFKGSNYTPLKYEALREQLINKASDQYFLKDSKDSYANDLTQTKYLYRITNYVDHKLYAFQESLEEESGNPEKSSGNIEIKLKLRLNNLKHTQRIENVDFILGIIEDGSFVEWTTLKLLKSSSQYESFTYKSLEKFDLNSVFILKASSIDTEFLKRAANEKLNLYLKVSNFQYERLGRTIQFKDKQEELENKLNTLIISSHAETKVIHHQKDREIREILTKLEIQYDEDSDTSEIKSLFKLENTLSPFLEPDEISEDKFAQGFWSFEKQDSVNLFSYSLGKEVYRANRRNKSQSVTLGFVTNGYSFKNLKLGQVLEFDISGTRQTPIAGDTEVISVESKVRSCQLHGDYAQTSCYWATGWCGVYHKNLKKINRSLEFPKHLDSFYFFGENEEEISLKDLLKEGSEVFISKDNLQMKFKILITEKLLSLTKSLRFKVRGDQIPKTINYGFQGFQDCEHKNKGTQFHFLSYNSKSYTVSGKYVDTLKLDINILN